MVMTWPAFSFAGKAAMRLPSMYHSQPGSARKLNRPRLADSSCSLPPDSLTTLYLSVSGFEQMIARLRYWKVPT